MPRPCSMIAFDLGAESGRALLGKLDNDRLEVSELSRFPNGMITVLGHQHWNVFSLFEHVKASLRQCGQDAGTRPETIGIDTWGVDFALLTADGGMLGLPYAYRDKRTQGAMESFFRKVPPERVYELTGIQILPINSLFQLESMVRDRSPLLNAAADLLFIPDLFNYLLTGVKRTEFTFATTSQLYNPRKMAWDDELLTALGLPETLMQQVVQPGTVIGSVSDEVGAEAGLGRVPVVAVATHDTGSAVAAAPAEGDDWAYISSGTWSLIGVESPTPIINEQTLGLNITNEGGVCGTFRVLKNLMGLWLLQQCRKAWSAERETRYADLIEAARNAPPFVSFVDPDHPSFLNPPDMPASIADFCRATGQPIPDSRPATVRCILESLALKYRLVLEQLRRVHGRPINRIHVIGGGSRNELLCQFTADATGLEVIAGPAEATAIGNLLVQAMAQGRVSGLAELRAIVRRSFDVQGFEPGGSAAWDAAYSRFLEVLEDGRRME